jgi:regulator of nucleoside diphosphate kinase
MRKKTQPLIVTKDDHQIIMSHLKMGLDHATVTRKEAEDLETELKKATLVEKETLPEDVVRLNSTVTVKDEKANKIMEVTLVTPGKADISQRRISILSPIGAALIGFRKGMKVVWKVPAGLKTFRILDVRHMLQGS